MMRRQAIAFGLVTALLVAGCSGGPTPGAVNLAPSAAPATQTAASQAPAAAATGGYQLTAEEAAMDCKKLTGRMQVRILQLRGFDPNKSQTSLIGSMFGAKSPAQRYQDETAQLQAYNARLAAQNCPTFDLEAELANKNTKHTPTPKPAATSQPAGSDQKSWEPKS